MVISKYLADETCFMKQEHSYTYYVVGVAVIGESLFVIRRNLHLLKLKRSCQSLDHLIQIVNVNLKRNTIICSINLQYNRICSAYNFIVEVMFRGTSFTKHKKEG